MIENIIFGVILLLCLIIVAILWYVGWRLEKIAKRLENMVQRLKPFEPKE